ncbi:hypothetical protein Hypma_013401 [Hypsizygus marmoreus]|uniref:Uncharacterized protein n=1 Tax=Hypsizygus marmoreus TaxID=39966 RepID=A0A369JFH3_HYPMA|nr:hypothetical protein Hypma_013401 [Hypsizygus marmoreus]
MPSKRSRSRSPARDLSRSPERRIDLPNNASPISESDYFQKSDEFRIWLKDEKRKYFDELSGDRARSYFRKFVKAWNRGKLPTSLYAGINPLTIPATTQTGYKWSFASKKTKADEEALRAAREQIGAATYGVEAPSQAGPSRGRVQGPTLPSASDLVLSRELASEQVQEERSYKRKRDKLEAKERVEDMVGPREVGREGMMEKKRARREADRSFRDKGDEGLEADESTLLGGGDSFRDQIARRDAARKRHLATKEDKTSAIRERASVFKEKEQATMDMFQQMAKQRFG